MVRRLLVPFVLVACGAGLASAAPPSDVSPPAGAALIGRYLAKGSQIYTCGSKDGALAWSAAVPEAELADGHSIIHHFKGPTWEARDGSKVVGTVIAKRPAPNPGTIPWLLLSAKATGSGLLGTAKYVTRQDTAGGVEPADACTTAGTVVSVPYTATYAFYQ